MSKKRVGIIGGTFDPIHNGHLILAEYSRLHFHLDEVLFIPAGNPPHKDGDGISPGRHRYNMTLLAISTNPHFRLSAMELEERDTTYTIHTIKRLQAKYPEVDFYFILGSDSFFDIHNWGSYKELVTLCDFIVLKRPDRDMDKELEIKVEKFNKSYNSSFHVLEAPLIEISSTDIRARVREGLSIKYLVPEGVESYIEKTGLYGDGNGK